MVTSYYRGHKIHCLNDEWFYLDTNKKISKNPDRRCGVCEKENTDSGHDHCIQNLPTVRNACCGHGNLDECYVQFNNGAYLQGKSAMEHLRNPFLDINEDFKLFEKINKYSTPLADNDPKVINFLNKIKKQSTPVVTENIKN